MKKIILFTILILTNYISIAQFKFGFTAGAQLSSVKIINYNTESRFSFNTGFAAKTTISDGIDFHIQIIVSGKGYTQYDSYGNKERIKPLYLELPLAFRFNFNSTKDAKIFIGAGGYYAFGIGGNKIYYPNGYKETQKIAYGNTNSDDFVQSDLGLVFQFGAAFRENYEGHFFYDMGLKKIIPNSTSNSFNRVFGFNLTWYF